jgi:hypothetical protein
MVYAIVEKCDLCRRDGRLRDGSYASYSMHGDPARPVKLRLCDRCWAGWDGHGGMFRGGSRLADRMFKNLQRLTKRPWQWSRGTEMCGNLMVLSSEFSIHEGTVMPGMTAGRFG